MRNKDKEALVLWGIAVAAIALAIWVASVKYRECRNIPGTTALYCALDLG